MISKVNFASCLSGSIMNIKSRNSNSYPNFRGLLDNPQAQRVIDKNGNTYIVEPGGHIVIHESPSDKKAKTLGTAAATGVGTSIATDKISDMRRIKTGMDENNLEHDTYAHHASDVTSRSIDDDENDIENSACEDFSSAHDVDDIDDDDDDDDDLI